MLFSNTGFDKRYRGSAAGSRLLSRLSSGVTLPERIELATDRPTIIAANHSSLFDLIASLILLDHYGINARIGVNARFFSNPAAGAFLRGIGTIPFSKADGGKAEDMAVEALLSGQAAALMPEGRITRPDDQVNGVGPGRPGVSRIARRANASVLPVGFAFADETWPPGTPLPKARLGRHRVVATVGSPIHFDTDDHIANADRLMSSIGDLVMVGRSGRT